MAKRNVRTFMGDFETTVFEGQTYTEVWASALVEIGEEEVVVHHSLPEMFDYLVSLHTNVVVYFHNLKFDGSFILDFLMYKKRFKQATEQLDPNDINTIRFLPPKEMMNETYQYSISDMGQWYKIVVKMNGFLIEFRDSLKLLPFSVKRIGKAFKTKHQKLDMEYEGFRYAGCEITQEEQDYIKNDVRVVQEALEMMFDEGHTKLTIGSCCLEEFKNGFDKYEYESLFPNLYEYEIPQDLYDSPNAGDYIRKSYKGGWCYLVKGKENKIMREGTTADVNSLYPSMMSSISGNRFPIGNPTFWKGNEIPIIAQNPAYYYFIRIRTRFKIKRGKLPCIQIKKSYLYKSTEWLETSDVYNPRTKQYQSTYTDLDGNVRDTRVTLTLTMTDFQLIKEHYNLIDFEILDGCYFMSDIGIFDNYMEKYKRIKMVSEGAKRELAKLFLNNLYGKMASSCESNFKLAIEREDRRVGFITIIANDKRPGYIAAGSAITSYSRNFTIRAAQKNYHGVHNRGFIYADTDSIHCDLHPDEIVGITPHETEFCCWKLEARWDYAIFTRQKTYIEHITHKDLKPLDEPELCIKCAGMPERCKKLLADSIQGTVPENADYNDYKDKYNEVEFAFVTEHRSLEDFDVGLCVPSKLLPKRIQGGIILQDTTYIMH